MASDTSLVFNIVARDRASATMGKIKDKFAAASAGIGAAVAGAMGVGLAANLDASAANAKLAAQLGVGPAEAAKLSKVSSRVYANSWGESTAQVDEAIKGVYQNIGDVSKAKGGLESVTTSALALSQTFDQDLGGVTAAVGQLMRTGLADNAQQAMDIVTTGFQNGANKADDLLDTLNEYAPQFAKLHMSGTDALNGITQFVKAGARDADAAADAFKEFGLRAISTGKTTTDAYKDLHLDADATRQAIAGGGPAAQTAMQQVFDSLKSVKDPVEQNRLGTALMGTQWEDTVRAILPKIDLTKNAIGNVSGATDQMAKTISSSPAAAIETFKRGAVQKLSDVAGHFVQFAMDNQKWVTPIAVTLGIVAAAIVAVQLGTMAWTAATTAWSVATSIATGVQWLWNAALAANPIVLIIIAVVALVAAVVYLWNTSATFREFWQLAWALIWGAIQFVWDWIKAHWPLLLAILTGPIGLAVLAIVKNWDKIKAAGLGVWHWISDLPGKIAGALSGLGRILVGPFKWGFNQIAHLWNGSVGSLSFHIPSWVPGVGGRGFSMPNMPYLAKGGVVTGSGLAMVGERGPEVVNLPTGASVHPLTRSGGGAVTLLIEFSGPAEMKKLLRSIVRTDGRGSVQTAFGQT